MRTLSAAELVGCMVNSISHREDEEEYLTFLRFTDRQIQVYEPNAQFHQMSLCSSGVYLTLDTNGDELSLSCKIAELNPIELVQVKGDVTFGQILHTLGETLKNVIWAGGQLDISQHFDLYIDDVYINSVSIGSGQLTFSLPNPEHEWVNVKIWFPLYKPLSVRQVSINGEWRNTSEKRPVLYAFGDSITQGFVAGKPSFCYIAQLAELLGYNALNQGIGGAMFDPIILDGFENLAVPDLITVAYGTNDWSGNPSYEKIKEQITLFFVRLHQLYPNVPTYVLTPIWRTDMDDIQASGTFTSITQLICDIAGAYSPVQIIEGLKISPRNPAFYADGSLHPNISGFSYMASRLFKAIKDSLPASHNHLCNGLRISVPIL
ncbi:MAG TPA: hypothetical protein DD640_00640 [Clostridiales bacterium]|nr:hypothetical protein [Clostridiales bacterium]